MPTPRADNSIARVAGAATVVLLGTILTSSFFQTWDTLVSSGHAAGVAPAPQDINVSFAEVFFPCVVLGLAAWIIGGGALVWIRGLTWIDALASWGWYGWIWWCVLDVWEWLWIFAGWFGWTSLGGLLLNIPQFWLAGCLACWMTSWLVQDRPKNAAESQPSKPTSVGWLWLAGGLYIVVFTTMNWRLYFNLLVPHGDSAMYEEHLWNLLHGKGFRSYLDQGLFFGEHIQFVHLFLIPLYIIWPSHLLLEACSSTALACGAFPVYWMVRRHTGSDRTALAAAVAYLLYFPMQFLDIEIDLKTFRPESFGIPLLLLTLDQLDRRNLLGTLIGIASCLTVKEDYAIIFGPLGVWIALSRVSDSALPSDGPPSSNRFANARFRLGLGFSISVFSVAYLWLATRVIIPWFRKGAEVHYASYFAQFGKTPEEIVHTMATNPLMLFNALVTTETVVYAIAMLAPLAFFPLLAPGRLAVGLPLFGILCLNGLPGSRFPQHQFHAPLVAIVFWSLAAALPRAIALANLILNRWGRRMAEDKLVAACLVRNLVWTGALCAGLFFSLSPFGIRFWDSNSSRYWGKLYGPTHRADMFGRIADLIPESARVASTDFVHPRYTHFERSYDYSEYQRKINGPGNRVPDDTDYIVIDTDHHYSKIKQPAEVPELQQHPERWELLPDRTEGCFIVLKRKKDES